MIYNLCNYINCSTFVGNQLFYLMERLFEYSRSVDGQFFVGRKEDVLKLTANFIFLTNTVVVAPQGWGKTSLVLQAARSACAKEPNLKFCHVDISTVRDEEQLLVALAQSVLRSVSENIEDVVSNVKRYFTRIEPRLSFGSESAKDITLDFDRCDVCANRDLFIDLPYTVSKATGLKIVVCIDEFHNIDTFSDPQSLLMALQECWNLHRNVAYCLCGNGNAMMEKFVSTAKSFRMFGERLNLGRISYVDLIKYIRDRFADSGKYIDDEMAGLIIDMVDSNPFYIQQLAHISWMNTSVVCSREVIVDAFNAVVDSMHLTFSTLTYGMTSQQLCYLHAVLSGEKVISSSDVLHRHGITSATSASRSKASLLEKGIIHISGGCPHFSDPLYAYWLAHKYFKH